MPVYLVNNCQKKKNTLINSVTLGNTNYQRVCYYVSHSSVGTIRLNTKSAKNNLCFSHDGKVTKLCLFLKDAALIKVIKRTKQI